MAQDTSQTIRRPSSISSRLQRFVDRYVDSPAKAELLRVLAFNPSQFHTLSEILALTRSSAAELERTIFSLRNQGLVQIKDSPAGTAVALAYGSAARRLAPALWSHLRDLEAPALDGARGP